MKILIFSVFQRSINCIMLFKRGGHSGLKGNGPYNVICFWGRTRRCGIFGDGMSLGICLKVWKTHTRFSVCLPFCVDQIIKLLATNPMPYLSASCPGDNGIILWKHRLPIKCFLLYIVLALNSNMDNSTWFIVSENGRQTIEFHALHYAMPYFIPNEWIKISTSIFHHMSKWTQ